MAQAPHPTLYEVNPRLWLGEIAGRLGRPATLDDIPDGDLDRIAAFGFDWVWLLGVWRTGSASRHIARTRDDLRAEYLRALPDLRDDDIGGSCFAVARYSVHEELGGEAALERLRRRLRERGIRLMLDFVPNHTATDHHWVETNPEFYVAGTEEKLEREPGNYVRLRTGGGEMVLAHGRDPYFPAWTDTLQLDYGNPALREASASTLCEIAALCDGVRCDMAMLALPEVFERIWRRRAGPFWPEAIARVRERYPGFVFLAEAYWDLEWTLQQQGFDYAYDKRLYDRLRDRRAGPVRDHLRADLAFQEKLARFLENHDEPRAAATFPPGVHEAAAAVTYLGAGLRFFHAGQLDGRKVRVPVPLRRGPAEAADPAIRRFYDRLLACLRMPALRQGRWRLLECARAWADNPTSDCFIAFSWRAHGAPLAIVAVNYAPHRAQCRVKLPFPDLRGRTWRLRDLLGDTDHTRDENDLAGAGLYLDEPEWACHCFAVEP